MSIPFALPTVPELVPRPKLVADIGGTNARFALEIAPGKFEALAIFACADHAMLPDAVRAYLTQPDVAMCVGIELAGLAIATPVNAQSYIARNCSPWNSIREIDWPNGAQSSGQPQRDIANVSVH